MVNFVRINWIFFDHAQLPTEFEKTTASDVKEAVELKQPEKGKEASWVQKLTI